ncbi:MAG: hypothetical protein ACRDPC_24220 [Solirubrobacteraceae bacterium]
MSRTTAQPQVRRVVLVPAAASSSRGDELVRRYRLARVRLEGREGAVAARTVPTGRGG